MIMKPARSLVAGDVVEYEGVAHRIVAMTTYRIVGRGQLASIVFCRVHDSQYRRADFTASQAFIVLDTAACALLSASKPRS